MAKSDTLDSILQKGLALSAEDVRAIDATLASMPLDESNAIEPWIWEGVALIVNDEQYRGDAKLPADA